MNRYHVTYTRRHNVGNRHESISHLGGHGWEYPVSQVINLIAFGLGHFYTAQTWRGETTVYPWPDRRSGPYVRTATNGLWDDNLLALPIR